MREETGYGTAEKTGDEREEGQESEQKWGQVRGQEMRQVREHGKATHQATASSPSPGLQLD